MTRFEISVLELYGYPNRMVLIPHEKSIEALRARDRTRTGLTVGYVALAPHRQRLNSGLRMSFLSRLGRISV